MDNVLCKDAAAKSETSVRTAGDGEGCDRLTGSGEARLPGQSSGLRSWTLRSPFLSGDDFEV